MKSILMETATNSRPISESGPSDLGECAPRFQAILNLDAIDADCRLPRGESGQRTAAVGLPVAARRARSEVPVIAVTM